jgi:putative colanic acid biosynthesis UDP-glucose lipid carrier transferase
MDNSRSLSSWPQLKPITNNPELDNITFFHLDQELGAFINTRKFITPFRSQPLDNTGNRILKRFADILFSSIVIVGVLSWLIPLIGLFIKMDSKGPIFFRQKRNKRNGEVFFCLKFRSMIVNEDADILPAEKNDKRITRIGSFLREHYLDELPQFFNVIWGDMSVIGPRPHMISDNMFYDKVIKNYSYRHKVKPGITGLAQALGYVGVVDDKQKITARVNIDVFYVRHWSPRLDTVIFFRTIKKLLASVF